MAQSSLGTIKRVHCCCLVNPSNSVLFNKLQLGRTRWQLSGRGNEAWPQQAHAQRPRRCQSLPQPHAMASRRLAGNTVYKSDGSSEGAHACGTAYSTLAVCRREQWCCPQQVVLVSSMAATLQRAPGLRKSGTMR